MDDISRVDLNLLKAFDALLDSRSVTKAAQRLGLTQPAVSGMLTRLRHTFNDPLFVRGQRGVLPTPRALALAGPLRQTLLDIAGLLNPAAFVPAQADLTLAIAATDYAQNAVLVPLLAILRAEAPSIRVSARPVVLHALAQQLENGELDMAVITPDMGLGTLRRRALFDEHYVCITRQGHPLAGRSLDIDTFCALDFALMSHDGAAFYGVTDIALASLGRTRRVVAAVPSFLVLINLVRHSDLAAVVPARLTEGEPDLQVQALPFAIPGFTKILAWHERVHADPAHRWLRDRLASGIGAHPA
jgi:DNA-binding transcriptional LysR family regulator